MRDITWIFFDVGGTLVDETDSMHRRVMQTVALQRSLGREYAPEVLERAMRDAALAGGSYFRGAMRSLGITAFAPYDAVGERLYAGTEAVLSSLASRYRLGVIANQPLGTAERLDRYGIGRFFTVILSSAEEGVEKPDREIFLRALARAGCQASEACMVGDRPDNDIAPAAALGMRTVRVTQGLGGMMPVTCETMRADATVSDLTGLIPIFLP
ncbi:MAG: HAD family hydrolase [Clostridia bacterium]|nr:HAD family hydrolase [Clostridia bacterium]